MPIYNLLKIVIVYQLVFRSEKEMNGYGGYEGHFFFLVPIGTFLFFF
jgi:hypothetical protein